MQSEISFTVSVPTDAIGLLIGKSGKTLNKLSLDSKCNINLQSNHDREEGNKERAVILTGKINGILFALRSIMAILASRKTCSSFPIHSEPVQKLKKKESTSNELLKWAIPQSLCGKLIGKAGQGIRSINAQSGAWVKIGHIEEVPPGSEER